MSRQQSLGKRIPSPILRLVLELLWSKADGFEKRLVVVILVLVLSSSLAAGLVPLLVKVVIDSLESNGAGTVYLAPFFLIAVYAITSWLARALGELRGFFHGRADQHVQRQLSHQLFRHLMSLPLRFHLDRKTGALSQTLVNGLMGYRMVLHHLMLTMLPVLVELATMGVVLIVLDQTLFLLVICVSVLLYTVAFWAGVTRIGRSARAVSNAHIDANAVLTDSILNYETVKYFGAEAQVQGRFVEALGKTEGEWAELFRCKLGNGLVVAAIFALSLGATMCLAAFKVQEGSMSIGTFVLINAYVLQITRPLEMIGFAFRDIAQAIAFIEEMSWLLEQKPEVGHLTVPASLSADRAELAFEHVSFSYHPDRRVLSDVNFVVPPGKTMAITGTSGSGKSSVIRLLVRLVEPTEGRICLNGLPLADIPIFALRNAVAVVPQDVALFNDSIAYNIAFGRQNSTRADIVRAAKVAHIHDFIVRLPDGYETMVGERGLKLSGGEKQRVAIARAAINRPKIFVFDEATSSLDSRMEQSILHDLMKVTKTTTTLIIAHRLSTVVHADEIIVLHEGRVVDRGTHWALLQRCGAYSMMWRTQNGSKQVLQHDASIA